MLNDTPRSTARSTPRTVYTDLEVLDRERGGGGGGVDIVLMTPPIPTAPSRR